MLKDTGAIATNILVILFAAGYVWSFIIAWRVNKPIFFLVLIFWIIGYPILLAKYWPQTKNNFYFLVTSFALAFLIAVATNPDSRNYSQMLKRIDTVRQLA
jgi:hypothetical protein